VITGSARYSYTKSVATKCWSFTDTDTSVRPGFVLDAGVTQLTCDALWKVAGALVSPKRQYIVPPSNMSDPYRCTTVPPDKGPKVGLMESTSGTDTYSKDTPDVLASTPFTDTPTDTVPAA
jgi:hypothetical protein